MPPIPERRPEPPDVSSVRCVASDQCQDGIGVWWAGPDSWHLRNSLSTGPSQVPPFTFGDDALGDRPVTGDWDGDGRDGIGVWRAGPDSWHLRNSLSTGPSQVPPFTFGDDALGDRPVTGDWDGQ